MGDHTVSERWLAIVGFEGFYEVSDLGRIKSLHGNGCIRATPLVRGYPSLFLSRSGQKTFCYVHILVARAFIGPCPDGKEVAHANGDSRDASLGNLRYATPVENDADKIAHGTRPNGHKNGQSKLTEQQAIEIKSSDWPTIDLAVKYGVSRRTIQKIIRGDRWGHLG